MNPLPDRGATIEPGTVYEVVWTSYMPLNAAATLGKVHKVTAESYPRTLCGIKVARPSKRFVLSDDLARCKRCMKKEGAHA